MNILYLHGMGGGEDSRIPNVLNDFFKDHVYVSGDGTPHVLNVIIKTYDFDPEKAAVQISGWVKEFVPVLIMGESLGSIHAIRVKRIPHILVSPSLGAPTRLWIAGFIPGVKSLLSRMYKVKDGKRQKLHFKPAILRQYRKHYLQAVSNSVFKGGRDYFYAFFGVRDHYMKTGIVSVKKYEKLFGGTYSFYDGSHFMENEYLYSMLIPKILEVLSLREK